MSQKLLSRDISIFLIFYYRIKLDTSKIAGGKTRAEDALFYFFHSVVGHLHSLDNSICLTLSV